MPSTAPPPLYPRAIPLNHPHDRGFGRFIQQEEHEALYIGDHLARSGQIKVRKREDFVSCVIDCVMMALLCFVFLS